MQFIYIPIFPNHHRAPTKLARNKQNPTKYKSIQSIFITHLLTIFLKFTPYCLPLIYTIYNSTIFVYKEKKKKSSFLTLEKGNSNVEKSCVRDLVETKRQKKVSGREGDGRREGKKGGRRGSCTGWRG